MQAGLDSLGAVELRNAIGIAFKLELPATIAFDYPTASSLAGFISSQLTGRSGAGALPGNVARLGTDRRKGLWSGGAGAEPLPSETVDLRVMQAIKQVLGRELPQQQPIMEVRMLSNDT